MRTAFVPIVLLIVVLSLGDVANAATGGFNGECEEGSKKKSNNIKCDLFQGAS